MTDEQAPHVCGKCRNPWTGGREDCPNNRAMYHTNGSAT